MGNQFYKRKMKCGKCGAGYTKTLSVHESSGGTHECMNGCGSTAVAYGEPVIIG